MSNKPIKAKDYILDTSEGPAKWDPRVVLQGNPIMKKLEKEDIWKRDENDDYLNGGPQRLFTMVKASECGQKYIVMGEGDDDTFVVGHEYMNGMRTRDGLRIRGIGSIAAEHFLKNPHQTYIGSREIHKGYKITTNLDFAMGKLKEMANS